MENITELYDLMEHTAHKYAQFEKKTQTIDDLKLTHVEVHTIACIGDHSNLNLSTLANLRGISKSAASQMIGRLRKKGLVNKQTSPDSEAAITLTLTESGKKVYEHHKKYHENTNSGIFQILKDLPEDAGNALITALKVFNGQLDQWLKK